MKKTYKLENLDCANCALKIENAINKINGVEKATVNYLTQKLTLEADDYLFTDILNETEKVIKKVEPDCHLVK